MTTDQMEALDRLGAKCAALPEDERAPYLLLCMAILASHAPEVLNFLFDRADERLEASA